MLKPTILIMSLLGLAAAQFGIYDTPNNCIGQGPGSCQFTLVGFQNPNPTGLWQYAAALYDHECNVIGYMPQVSVGTAIDSQLPYTVDITSINDPIWGYGAQFNYAGGGYGQDLTGSFTWDCTADNVGCNGFRAAFPCPGF
ncbi:hypothetical protein V1506DRAFT_545562 [Lipomyces tetrasporus]